MTHQKPECAEILAMSKTVRVEHWDDRPPTDHTFHTDPRWPLYYLEAAEHFASAMRHLGNKAEVLP